MRTYITQFFKNLQDNICQQLEQTDGGAKFREDVWERDGGGGGRSRILENGNIIEKGGVNFSAVFGEMPPVLKQHADYQSSDFYATGVSIVIHPHNPHVPIIHMNVRYFETNEGKTAWFGGGIDLTPHYVVAQDAKFFHQSLKNVCNQHHHSYYDTFKDWADKYFFIKHRNETRGIGGIFFDRLSANEHFTLEDRGAFVQALGNSFVPIYTTLMKQNKDKPFDETQRQWQYLRRGRYVEFNLVYDAGTKFGLDTSGRIESILMSLPAFASWIYDFQTIPNSPEAQTLALLKKGIDWV